MQRSHRRVPLLVAALALAACADAEAPAPPAPASAEARTAWVQLGDGLFELELALDPASRFRGLSHRSHIPPDGGMLFAFPRAAPRSFVMRHCPIPIDIAFLDAEGRILAIHEMKPEPPKRPDESPFEYESRLRGYRSHKPARFAVETAGGRLAAVGARVGGLAVFDAAALAARAR